METPKHRNVKTPILHEDTVQDITARLVANKAFFMNEIYELKREITSLTKKVGDWEGLHSNIDKENIIKNLELQISLLQQENLFIKTELQQKQKTIDSLLDFKKDQLINDNTTKDINHGNKLSLHQQGNPSSPSSQVNSKKNI